MPQMMKWVYIMLLKYQGFVTCYREERLPHDYDLGWRTIRYYTITGAGRTLEITLDDERGIIDGNMTIEKNFNPIYEIGSGKPATYVPGPSQIHYRSAK